MGNLRTRGAHGRVWENRRKKEKEEREKERKKDLLEKKVVHCSFIIQYITSPMASSYPSFHPLPTPALTVMDYTFGHDTIAPFHPT